MEFMESLLLSRDDVAEYIKARLGYPATEIEMEVENRNGLGHLELAIQDTLKYFYRYALDEAAYSDYLKFQLVPGVMEYEVPEGITAAIEMTPSYGNTFSPMMAWDVGPGESLMGVGGAGLGGLGQFDLITYAGAMRYLADVKKLVGTQYNIKLNVIERMMRVYPTPRSPRVAICRVYRKAKQAEVYNNILFQEMVVARAGMQLGIILSKDSITLPGGGQVNGEGIYTKYQTIWDKGMETIKNEAPRPFMMTELSN